MLRAVCSIGEPHDWEIETAASAWNALDRLQSGGVPHLLLLDVPRGDSDILHVLRWLRRFRSDLPIIMLSYPEDAGWRIESMRLGAQDFLLKPIENDQLELAIQRHLGVSVTPMDFSTEAIEPLPGGAFFISTSPLMRKLRAQAELLAQADVPVLIVGERGSGKKTAARLIHKLSVRADNELVRINCSGIPEAVLEAELFGTEDSVSSDSRSRLAILEVGDKGTILLDAISEMPDPLQSRLLRVIQEKRFTRTGGDTPLAIDVRVLATATSENIEQVQEARKLREDLYYRLSAFTLHVPPLRHRMEEIPLLLQHFMHKLAGQHGMTPRPYTPAVIEACQSYEWPGNLTEFENFVKRYLVMGEQDLRLGAEEATNGIHPTEGHLGADRPWNNREIPGGLNSLKSLVRSVKLEAERSAIATALEKTGWNRRAAARLLHVSYRTLLYKIEQYQMRAPAASSVGNGLKGSGWRAS